MSNYPAPSNQPPYGQYPQNDPYAQPYGAAGQYPLPYGNMMTSEVQRPGAVTAIAVLAICFGGLTVLGSLCTIPQYIGLSFMPNPVMNAMRADKPVFLFTIFSLGVGLVLGLFQLFGGIRSLSLSQLGRSALIFYAWGRLISAVIEFPVQLLLIRPRTTQITTAVLKSSPAMSNPSVQTAMKFGQIFGVVFGVLLLAWPVIVLVVMTRTRVKTAFRVAATH